MNTALTIAGSDSSGGAGIQADLKTFLANGVYGMSVITAVTAQNTMGVYEIFNIPEQTVAAQLDAVFTDIYPNAVKIGMVSSAENAEVIAEKLRQYKAKNIVLDTVMSSTSGSRLTDGGALGAITSLLFPLADVITPNIPEAEALAGGEIKTENDMVFAARKISVQYNVNVLLKGGHLENTACDILCRRNGAVLRYDCERINNPNTHGTGCTLSSAIAASLAKGEALEKSIGTAKEYITKALKAGLDLGKGSGPISHGIGTER